MFFPASAYAIVSTISGFIKIYIDPHLPHITASRIYEYCVTNDIHPGGVSIIEVARLLHYGDEYKALLEKIKSAIELFPECAERHVTSDGDFNIEVDAIMIAESKIEILSPFICNFKIAETFYAEVLVDPDFGTHEHVDSRIFEHFVENRHKEDYLYEDAFIDIVMSYKKSMTKVESE